MFSFLRLCASRLLASLPSEITRRPLWHRDHPGDDHDADDDRVDDRVVDVNGWWVIHSDVMLRALREVANGADPDLVMLELEANAEQDSQ